MTRARWKPNFLIASYLRKPYLKLAGLDTRLSNLSRQKVLLDFVSSTILLHNGTKFQSLEVSKAHVGYRLGEFIFTRSRKR